MWERVIMNTSETPGRKIMFRRARPSRIAASIVGGAVIAVAVGISGLGRINTSLVPEQTLQTQTQVVMVPDTRLDQTGIVQDIVLSAFDTSSDKSGQLSMLNHIIAQHPDDPLAYHTRGVFFAGEGQYNKALADYTTAIDLNPQFAEAYLNRAHVYDLMGELGQACADYNQTLRLNPQLIEVYQYRGSVYYRLGEYRNAIDDLTIAIQHQPTNDSYVMRGLAYGKLNWDDAATSDFHQARHYQSSSNQDNFNRGTDYYWSGEYDKAIVSYSNAILADPNYAEAYNGRAYSYFFNDGNLSMALQDIAMAIALQPNNPSYYDSRCEFYLRSGEWSLGLEDCRTAQDMGWSFSTYMNALIMEAISQIHR